MAITEIFLEANFLIETQNLKKNFNHSTYFVIVFSYF